VHAGCRERISLGTFRVSEALHFLWAPKELSWHPRCLADMVSLRLALTTLVPQGHNCKRTNTMSVVRVCKYETWSIVYIKPHRHQRGGIQAGLGVIHDVCACIVSLSRLYLCIPTTPNEWISTTTAWVACSRKRRGKWINCMHIQIQ